MKKLIGLIILACGLFVYPCLSFAENIYAHIVITPGAYTGFFGGLVGGDGNPGPNSIDWGIGNSVPFGGMTDDMVFSTATGDFIIGSNWKERMRITKDGNVGIGTSNPKEKLQIGDRMTFHDGGYKVIGYNAYYDGVNDRRIVPDYVSGMAFTNVGDIFFRTAGDGPAEGILDEGAYSTFNTPPLIVKNDGKIGVGTENPDHPLEMASGAHVTTGGVWTNASSREYKENIRDLSYDEATSALSSLKPSIVRRK